MVESLSDPRSRATILQLIAEELATSSEAGLCLPRRMQDYAQGLRGIAAELLVERPSA